MTLHRQLTASARLAELPADVQDAVRADREQAEQRARDETKRSQAVVRECHRVMEYMHRIATAANEGGLQLVHNSDVVFADSHLETLQTLVKEATSGK